MYEATAVEADPAPILVNRPYQWDPMNRYQRGMIDFAQGIKDDSMMDTVVKMNAFGIKVFTVVVLFYGLFPTPV